MSSHPPEPRGKLKQDAERLARRAIALDESLADGHVALGLVKSHWADDLTVAEREFERALSLDPKAPQAREYLSLARLLVGKRSESISDARLAVDENPLSPAARATLGIVLYANGRCDAALPILDSLALLKPPLLRTQIARSLCLSSEGRWREAATAVEQEVSAGVIRAMGVAGFALARNGDRDAALAIQNKLRNIAQANSAAYFDVALVSYGFGQIDEASAALGLAANSGVIPWELMAPMFEPLRQTSPVKEIATRHGIRLASF